LPNPLAATDDKTGATPDDATRKTENVEPPIAANSPVEADTPIALSFLGTSWVEVRDGTGVLVLSTTGVAGATQSVGGRAPFEVVLGNAAVVNVSWQGKPFDTAPFIKQNVAKFTLR
jgi:cytoskeleton protein RodZ